MILDQMTSFEKDLVILFFGQHMSMEQRRRLMAELPVAYNHLCGDKIVQVVSIKDGSVFPEVK